MSNFSCPVVQVSGVENHPNADRLSIVRLKNLGYTAISAKLEDGSHRYSAGDFVTYIPMSAVLPEFLLREMGFWDENANIGKLAGKQGNRVKPLKLRGIYSEGVLRPVINSDGSLYINNSVGDRVQVFEGEDTSQYLDIVKYEPPVPTHLAGEMANIGDVCVRYDFERMESVPDMFDASDMIVATEKLHGTMCSLVYIPNLNHPEMFGRTGNIIVHSKGLGAKGLAFKNNEANASNLYVRILKDLLTNHNLENVFEQISGGTKTVAVLGEIFGKGVQDLDYGTVSPQFRVFEMIVDRDFLDLNEIEQLLPKSILRVPVLYSGLFNMDNLIKARDGKTTVGGNNIREGIVVKASDTGNRHSMHGRKIAKMISPAYLLRKNDDATEYT